MARKVCIVGQRGQVSLALQAALSTRPQYAVTVVSTEDALAAATPSALLEAEIAILCTLEFSSQEVAVRIPESVRILDVSPAFRTDPDWVYGLPELPGVKAALSTAPRVANPGCFATSAILALVPLLRSGLLSTRDMIYLDGAGGYTTGGARMVEAMEQRTAPIEAAYSLAKEHRHVSEIRGVTGVTGPLWFTPKIAGVPRGIRMQVPVREVSRDSVLQSYSNFYAGSAVIVDESQPSKLAVDYWANKPGASIHVFDHEDGCMVVVCLDNLGKGAVDSAVDNIALMLGE